LLIFFLREDSTSEYAGKQNRQEKNEECFKHDLKVIVPINLSFYQDNVKEAKIHLEINQTID